MCGGACDRPFPYGRRRDCACNRNNHPALVGPVVTSPQEYELIDLASATIQCARERQFVAAGMWIKEAFDVCQSIGDVRKRKLALKLLEAVLEAVEIAQSRGPLVSATLHRMRTSRPGPLRVPVGPTLCSRESRPDLLPVV